MIFAYRGRFALFAAALPLFLDVILRNTLYSDKHYEHDFWTTGLSLILGGCIILCVLFALTPRDTYTAMSGTQTEDKGEPSGNDLAMMEEGENSEPSLIFSNVDKQENEADVQGVVDPNSTSYHDSSQSSLAYQIYLFLSTPIRTYWFCFIPINWLGLSYIGLGILVCVLDILANSAALQWIILIALAVLFCICLCTQIARDEEREKMMHAAQQLQIVNDDTHKAMDSEAPSAQDKATEMEMC